MIDADTDETPLAIDLGDDDLHPEAEAFVAVFYGTIEVLELLKATETDALRGSGWTQTDVDAFVSAFRAGEAVLDSEAWPDGLKADGFEALPADLETEVRESMVPLADVFDVDLEPAADPGLSTAARQYVAAKIDAWRRSE